jgi:5-methylthioadenosine/S-adenosylhomocysteine deaminase
MRTLVLGDPLVHLGDEPFIRDGGLVVEDGRIVAVGPRARFESGNYDRIVGGPSHFVLPGFVNCHFHSENGIGEGIYDVIWERANIWVHGAFLEISEEDLYHSILQHLIKLIRGGNTAVVDMYNGNPRLPHFGAEAALRAYEDVGLRVAFGMITRDQNFYVHGDNDEFLSCVPRQLADEVRASPIGHPWPVDEVLESYVELVRAWDRRGDLIRVITAPDWTPACSDDLYRRNRALADEYATGLTTHILETRSEMMYNLERHGKPGARRLAEIGALGPDSVCAHFVWATDEDIDVVAETGAVVASNPASNLRLSSGICRVRDILDRGGRVGFGTDGNSFGGREDFLDELRLAGLLQCRPMERLAEGRISSEKLLRAAAANGARAVRFDDRIGTLTPGKDADLLVLRRDRVFFPPHRFAGSDPLDVIVDRADSTDIESVMIRGRLVMDEGRITTVDEAGVVSAYAEAAATRLWRYSAEQDRYWAKELPAKFEPYVLEFYSRWAGAKLAPGYAYNTTTGPLGPVEKRSRRATSPAGSG